MKKITLLSVLIGLFGYFSYSQTYRIHVKPVGSKTWKYADIKGEIVVNCDYPVSYQFSEDGIAAVYYPKKNLYLLINSRGEEISTQISEFFLKDVFGYGAKGYSDGLIAVMVDKKWGYMDTAGKLAVPLKYDNLSEFNNGYGVGKIDENFLIINNSGKELLVEDKDIIDIKPFSENLAPYTSKDDRKGYIDTTGKIAIPSQFLEVGYFCNGFAWAKSTEYLLGYINKKGEWIIKPQYTAAKDFDQGSGLARVKKGETWAYIDATGETISFDISEISDDFYERLARGKKAYLFGFYNNKGEWVIQPQFEGVRDFKNGFAAAKANGLWGIIDKEGKWVIKPTFIGIKDVIPIK